MEISRRLFCVFYPRQFWNEYELVFLDFFVLCFKFCQIKNKQTNKQTNKKWTEAEFSASRVTTLRRLQEKGYQARNNIRSILPGLRRKRTGLLLSGPKSSFQMKVNFAFHLEIKVWRKTGEAQNPCCLKSSVKFLKSVMIWGAVTSAGVGPLCFIKSKVNAAVYQEILGHFMLPSADKLYGDADFLFQQDFSTCPQCQNHFQVLCWPWYYRAWLASQHAWPEPHMESMGYFQEKDEKQLIQQYRRAEGSIVPQQCHRLIASMPHLTDAGVCAKGAPTKYWVHCAPSIKWTYFKELELFCLANPFF